jgi:hypothetical protein
MRCRSAASFDEQNSSHSSLAVDRAGNPHISYSGNGLQYARWTGSNWIVQGVDNVEGYDISLALDGRDNPRISYSGDGVLKYAYWEEGDWLRQTVSNKYTSFRTSLALDNAGNPHISYIEPAIGNSDLKYAVGSGSGGYWIAPDHGGALEPGGQAIYLHTLQNTSNLSATFYLTGSSSQNWSTFTSQLPVGTTTLPISLTLMSGQAAVLRVTVTVPNTDAVRGMIDNSVVTATSSFSPTLAKRVTDTTLVPRAHVYLPIILRN